MGKHCFFHVQSCLGMVSDILEHFDYPTMLTNSDPFLKGTFPNFESFDSQSWVEDDDDDVDNDHLQKNLQKDVRKEVLVGRMSIRFEAVGALKELF